MSQTTILIQKKDKSLKSTLKIKPSMSLNDIMDSVKNNQNFNLVIKEQK